MHRIVTIKRFCGVNRAMHLGTALRSLRSSRSCCENRPTPFAGVSAWNIHGRFMEKARAVFVCINLCMHLWAEERVMPWLSHAATVVADLFRSTIDDISPGLGPMLCVSICFGLPTKNNRGSEALF